MSPPDSLVLSDSSKSLTGAKALRLKQLNRPRPTLISLPDPNSHRCHCGSLSLTPIFVFLPHCPSPSQVTSCWI